MREAFGLTGVSITRDNETLYQTDPPAQDTEQGDTPIRNLLQSGELLQQVINQLRSTRQLLETKLGASPDETILLSLADLETTLVASQLSIADHDLAEYISDLTPQEIRALLDFKKSDLDKMTVHDLEISLASEETVEKKTRIRLVFSPLVQLYAISDSGPKAQVLANTWAALFERMYDQLTPEENQPAVRRVSANSRNSATVSWRMSRPVLSNLKKRSIISSCFSARLMRTLRSSIPLTSSLL